LLERYIIGNIGGGVIVRFAPLDKAETAQVLPGRLGQPGSPCTVLINEDILSDPHYCQMVEERINDAHPQTLELAKELRMHADDLVILYTAHAVELGHIDPELRSSVLLNAWRTWAATAIWIHVYQSMERNPARKTRR